LKGDVIIMWVRLTFVKLQPDKLDETMKIYYEEIVPTVNAQKGIIDTYLMEPRDKVIISINSDLLISI